MILNFQNPSNSATCEIRQTLIQLTPTSVIPQKTAWFWFSKTPQIVQFVKFVKPWHDYFSANKSSNCVIPQIAWFSILWKKNSSDSTILWKFLKLMQISFQSKNTSSCWARSPHCPGSANVLSCQSSLLPRDMVGETAGARKYRWRTHQQRGTGPPSWQHTSS